MGRVLIVEDDPKTARTMEKILRISGHQVAAVDRGDDALEKLRTNLPDLVLLDVSLPDMDGLEVLRQIRAEYPRDELRREKFVVAHMAPGGEA